MQAVKYIFRYLYGTSHYKLKFQANDPNGTPLVVYVDLDWAEDCTDRKSISGLAVLLDGEAISWGSKKQSTVILSTVKAVKGQNGI